MVYWNGREISEAQAESYRKWNTYCYKFMLHEREIAQPIEKKIPIKEGIWIETLEEFEITSEGRKWNSVKRTGRKNYEIRLMVRHETLPYVAYETVLLDGGNRDEANREFLRLKKIGESLPDGYIDRELNSI